MKKSLKKKLTVRHMKAVVAWLYEERGKEYLQFNGKVFKAVAPTRK